MFWSHLADILPILAGAVAGWLAGGKVATRRLETIGDKLYAEAYLASKPKSAAPKE